MRERLLLVDDEKFLLESLQEGLLDYKDIFETDICYSVDEAIELSKKNAYDLIITDIRIPGKSGIELLMHLKEHRFQGKVMAMTAYGNEEIFAKINELGGMRIIVKPFDFKWFRKMLLDFFEEKKGFSGTIDSIDLTSLLQLINLERKSVIVKIEIDDKKGFLYFDKGEIVNAEFDDLEGKNAAVRLISLNRGRFFVLKKEKKVERAINVPFLTFIMNIMKDIDEEAEKEEKEELELDIEEKKVLEFQINKEIFDAIKEVFGFKHAGVFDKDGDLIVSEPPGNKDIKGLGRYGLQLVEGGAQSMGGMGFGDSDILQLQANQVIFLFTWVVKGKICLGVVIEGKGDIELMKIKIKEILKSAYKYVVS